VLILLPPSEGKAPAPRRGRPLDLASLSLPELTDPRTRVLIALESLAQGPRGAAVQALGLPAGLVSEVDKDAVLSTAPTQPAALLYTGVLYAALDLATLDAAATRRARRTILISSALFGAVRLTDRLPAYRLPPTARLPRIGTLASVWRTPLAHAIAEASGTGVIVDLRSTPYQAMARINGPMAERTVQIRVLHEAVPGDRSTRSIVSHFNKATKGLLTRTLVEEATVPRSTDDVSCLLKDHGWQVEDGPAAASGKPRTIDVIVAQV
jgi:cytoplasmic iron level regulating protein YaaA (DUF328/UPF0246 family)